jgi:hypothetical protein
MTIMDHDHSYLQIHPWTGLRRIAIRSKDQGSALGFVVFWIVFFALVAAVNYVLGWLS